MCHGNSLLSTGLLSSHGGMSLERLHTMLKLVVGSGGGDARFDMNLVELRRYLQSLADQFQIEIVDGVYSAVAPTKK